MMLRCRGHACFRKSAQPSRTVEVNSSWIQEKVSDSNKICEFDVWIYYFEDTKTQISNLRYGHGAMKFSISNLNSIRKNFCRSFILTPIRKPNYLLISNEGWKDIEGSTTSIFINKIDTFNQIFPQQLTLSFLYAINWHMHNW